MDLERIQEVLSIYSESRNNSGSRNYRHSRGPGAGFGAPGGGFGGLGGGVNSNRSSGKPLLLLLQKKTPPGPPKPPPGPPKSPPGQLEMGKIKNESIVNLVYLRLFVDSEVPGGFKKVRRTGTNHLDLVSSRSGSLGMSYDQKTKSVSDFFLGGGS